MSSFFLFSFSSLTQASFGVLFRPLGRMTGSLEAGLTLFAAAFVMLGPPVPLPIGMSSSLAPAHPLF